MYATATTPVWPTAQTPRTSVDQTSGPFGLHLRIPAPTAPDRSGSAAAATQCCYPLPAAAEDLGRIRHQAQTTLAAWQLPSETVDDALLVISELITNAVVHALPPAALHLRRTATGSCVRIEVSDGGPRPQPTDLDEEEHGRGLCIVGALSARNGTLTRPHGTISWAEIALPTDSPQASHPRGMAS